MRFRTIPLAAKAAAILGITAAFFAAAVNANAAGTYLALGDSYAFGYQTAADSPSLGDQGYVSLFADYLGTRDGGGRPDLINLARPGETTASFSASAASPTAPFNFNLNYSPGFNQSQATLLSSKLGGLSTAPDYITIQLGGNDVLGALFAQQSVPNAVAALTTNYRAILEGLRAAAPNAEIYVLGYANPFPGLPDNSPYRLALAQIEAASLMGNTAIEGLANEAKINATYVDIADAFTGQERQLSYILTNDANGLPNFHPNAAGYQVIADRLIAAAPAAAVPETGTLPLIAVGMGAGSLTLLVVRRRRPSAVRVSR